MTPPRQGRSGGAGTGRGGGAGRGGGGGGGRGSGGKPGGKGGQPDRGKSARSGAPGGRPGDDRGPSKGRAKSAGRAPASSASSASRPQRAKSAKTKQGLGGEQVEGRQAVRELLLAGRRKTLEVLFASGLDDAPILSDIIDLADEAKVPLRELGGNRFDAVARTESAQGVIAMAQPVPEHDLDELVRSAKGPQAPPPFLLAVDGVTDPGNLGALLRSAECAGVTGVVLPRHRAAHLSPTVTKAAAGAVEHLPMALVAGLPAALVRLKELGLWIVGLDGDAEDSLFDLQVATEPIVLVVGSEGRGISRLAGQRCDTVVSIPLRGALDSLNVSAAGALACYEVARRRA